MSSSVAWTSAGLASSASWRIDLTDADRADIESALAELKAGGSDPLALTRESFPLGALEAKLESALDELESRSGVVLMRGIPVAGRDVADCARIFYGLGLHLGRPMAQNPRGDMLGHVRDEGRDWKADPTARAYQTTEWLPFHTDPGDVVGLLCLRTAREGGLSSIASAAAIHDELLRESPQLAGALEQPLYYDGRGEQPPGELPWYALPAFERGARGCSTFFVREYIESAQRFADVPRLTEVQKAAMARLDELAIDPRFRFDMQFEPGDIQWLNNHVVLHSRTKFIDHDEPDRKRHLLRLWLKTRPDAEHGPSYRKFISRLERWPRRDQVFG